jgi:hypothetical protein
VLLVIPEDFGLGVVGALLAVSLAVAAITNKSLVPRPHSHATRRGAFGCFMSEKHFDA